MVQGEIGDVARGLDDAIAALRDRRVSRIVKFYADKFYFFKLEFFE